MKYRGKIRLKRENEDSERIAGLQPGAPGYLSREEWSI